MPSASRYSRAWALIWAMASLASSNLPSWIALIFSHFMAHQDIVPHLARKKVVPEGRNPQASTGP
ncbi:MAG: hypothetical protein PHD34_02715, partial [Methanothrix soehngenii]|nr:hypothetical protein [Methanothrix soehngenii]